MSDRVPTPVFYGRIEKGRPIMADPVAFQRMKESLEGHDIEIRISKRRRTRSINADRYFHGYVLPQIAEAAGFDQSELDMVKDGLKHKFLKINSKEGELETVRSTADLDEHEFARFIADCIRWAAETLHIAIRDPE